MDECITNMFFSMDLINFVMNKRHLDGNLGKDLNCFGESQFQAVIGEAVFLISSREQLNDSEESSLFKESLMSLKKASLKEISHWALSQCPEHMELESGFCPDEFITYCGKLCSLLEIYSLKHADNVVYEVLANVICNRLDGFTLIGALTQESWKNLVTAATKIYTMLKSLE